jgi:hypothetical protein
MEGRNGGSMRPHPHLFEANARIFLRRLAARQDGPRSLAGVPEEEWRGYARHFDLLWLMGVWERSPLARARALSAGGGPGGYGEALPDWTKEDVEGSPFAVHRYRLDPALGDPGDLALLRSRMNRSGLGLILDFVPNHLALDHPWTGDHPDWFVEGNADSIGAHSDWFFTTAGGARLAHGKDPNFPPWSDTVQVNFRSEGMRGAMIEELLAIAEVADGVRCDMAMLALNPIFESTWGWARPAGEPQAVEFWEESVGRVKARHPGFLFIAEAYWGLEARLLELGFDHAYDKTLYDRLRDSDAAGVREHLAGSEVFNRHGVRFIENHDEPRAPLVFPGPQARAALIAVATLPGLRLVHDGQREGRRIRLPVQLVREPEEPVDRDTAALHDRLLSVCRAEPFHEGGWSLLDVDPAWPGNDTARHLLSWCWQHDGKAYVVAVNYSPVAAQGRVRVPTLREGAGQLSFRDTISDGLLVQDLAELARRGLYVQLGPWAGHVFEAG